MSCLFCQMAAGEIPATEVYRSKSMVAFRDINPQAPTHILVIPVQHIESPSDLVEHDDAAMGGLLRTAALVAEQEGITQSGYRLVINSGPDANQTVPHLHIHVIGGRAMGWPPG